MNPYVLGVAALGGLWLLLRKDKPKALPPVPQPLPLPEGSEGGLGGSGFANAWDVLPYAYDVYPPGARLDNVPVPPAELGISNDEGCTTIAVMQTWWDHTASQVAARIVEGEVNPQTLYGELNNPCAGAGTVAEHLLRAAVLARIQSLLTAPGQGGDMTISTTPPLIQVALGAGSAVLYYTKPGVGLHTIITEPHSEYFPAIGQHVYSTAWRAWVPGPVTPGNYFREGKAPTPEEAVAEAKAAIDEYATVQGNRAPRRSGGRRRRRFALGFLRRYTRGARARRR